MCPGSSDPFDIVSSGEPFYIVSYITYHCVYESSDPFYVVTYYIKWVTTSWTYSIKNGSLLPGHT